MTGKTLNILKMFCALTDLKEDLNALFRFDYIVPGSIIESIYYSRHSCSVRATYVTT